MPTMTHQDLTPAQQRQLTRLQPVLFRLMRKGALGDVVELLTELDRFAARETPARTMTRPAQHTLNRPPDWQTWEQLLSPDERREAEKHDVEPDGMATLRSLDVLEQMFDRGTVTR